MKTHASIFLKGAVVAVIAVLSLMNLFYGNLNQDEGWYLYAGRMVRDGAWPYADFLFTQGPVFPLVYRLFYPIVDAFGVYGGRVLTLAFGVCSGLLAAFAASRAVKSNRLFVFWGTWILIGCNVYQSYFTTIVKTYGLCLFFLMAGFVALTYKGRVTSVLAGICLALAAGTRLSAGIVLPISGIWLILQKERRGNWLWFGIGGGVTLLALFAPFFISAYDQTCFGLFGYHAGRDPGGLKALLVLKMGFLSRFVQAYFVLVCMVVGLLFYKVKAIKESSSSILLWFCGLGISLVHFSASFPYDDYQVIAYPILVSACLVSIAPLVKERWAMPFLGALLLVSTAAAFSSPINQDWFVRGQDRIWWRFKDQSDLVKLREAADFVRSHSAEGQTLLTQDTYLAVQAGRTVPEGMEMGPFSYYPDLSREQAEKQHVINQEMLLEMMREPKAPLAAFSGYGLSISSPSVSELSEEDQDLLGSTLLEYYRPILSLPYFGQAHTTLTIYEVRDEE